MSRRIHPFNMVEIILAVGVVAIAIGSIMGLLPVALKANRDAVAENCMASASDIVRTYIESLDQGTGDSSFGNLRTTLPASVPADPNSRDASGSNILGDATAKLYALTPSGTYRLDFVSSSNNVDFSALVKIWRQNFTSAEYLYIPRRDTSTLVNAALSTAISASGTAVTKALYNGSTDASDIADVLQNIMVEISYPIDASAENRNTMTFSIPYAAKEQ